MLTEPKSINGAQYQCAFLDCATRIAPTTGVWTDWKPSAMFNRSYCYRINSGEYECTNTNDASMTRNTYNLQAPIGAVAERVSNEEKGHSTARYTYVCHAHIELYTLVQVSGLGLCDDDVMGKLDKEVVGNISDVLSIVPLPGESLEVVVRKSYVRVLTDKFNAAFLNVSVDLEYDSSGPGDEEISRLGYDMARFEAIGDRKSVV